MQGGEQYLAVPQLATDIAGQPPSMTVGDSDIDLLVFRLRDGRFEEHQRLAVAGGEDAEYFEIGGRCFRATASLRSGKGPYEMQQRRRSLEGPGAGSAARLRQRDRGRANGWQ